MSIFRIFPTFFVLFFFSSQLLSQANDCDPNTVVIEEFTGSIFYNYGTVSNTVNGKYSTSGSLGEAFTGNSFGQEYQTFAGFYGKFLLPPFPPIVTATQGDLLDRIQLNWEIDALSPTVSGGFNIYRDGIFLQSVTKEIRTFNDFNVIAGKAYNYSIRGINSFGEGPDGKAIGFQVPNGVVTGWIQSPNGNPVNDATVSLLPLQGFSGKFGPLDGAWVDTFGLGIQSFFPIGNNPWSLTFWVKTDSAEELAGLLKLEPSGVIVRPLRSDNGEDGIVVDIGGAANLRVNFPDSLRKQWHNIVLTYDPQQSMYRLYLDGVLGDFETGIILPDITRLNIGSQIVGANTWEGRLDELRIYHRILNELDFDEIIQGTASTLTKDLEFYWKFDEEQGNKSFDLIKRSKMFFCGAIFDADRPPVSTAGKTNDEGYYRIESASYGTGTTFIAKASKNFYLQRALKFTSSEMDHIALPDFALSPQSSLELWVNSSGINAANTLLSKVTQNSTFEVSLTTSGALPEINVAFNGNVHSFGNIPDMGYSHLAITIDSSGSNRDVSVYSDGNLLGSFIFSGVFDNLSDTTTNWYIGGHASGGFPNHFDGLVAEFAQYDVILPLDKINLHKNNKRDPQEANLRIYYPFNEGSGIKVNNLGSYSIPAGEVFGAEWTPMAPLQETTPHVFTPTTRQVTLNPSITSVDQVDFVDRSTIPVSGYVRYANTDCFAPNVEILFNGSSYSPAIFSDSTGKFSIEMDPGMSGTLSPKYADQQFLPVSWELINVNSPISGILFSGVTTRVVSGQIAGGLCKKSIIKDPNDPQGTIAQITISTLNGCLERTITLDNQEGDYEFQNLPPLENYIIAVTQHSDPAIKAAFDVKGGTNLDLSKSDSTNLDFIYFASPQVEVVSGLDQISPSCETIVLDQGDQIIAGIRLFESYIPNISILGDDGICELDTGIVQIINGFSDETKDTVLSSTNLQYEFKVGLPNPTPPFLKSMQIIGKSIAGRQGSTTIQGVVTGIFNKENTFTTKLPEIPLLILRDPPGDKSYSYWEKDSKVCSVVKAHVEETTGGGTNIELNNSPTVRIVAAPLGVGKIIKVNSLFGVETSGSVSYKKVSDDSFELCYSSDEKISTSASDRFIGEEGDVYVGLGTNIEIGFADEVKFNVANCMAELDTLTTVEPLSATTFMYSQHFIQNNVIRYIEDILNSSNLQLSSEEIADYELSKTLWQSFIQDNEVQKNNASFLKNYSFDAGAEYSFSETSDTTNQNNVSEYVDSNGKTRTFYGGGIDDVGVKADLFFTVSKSIGTNLTEETEKVGIKTGYVLSDDDRGDAFTVDVKMDTVYSTPVFDLVAGQSSCPWEKNTANREGPNLQLSPGSQFTAINVPSHEAAVFNLTLGNLSATNEDWTYGFSAIEANNPNGAIIRLNGGVLNKTQRFIVPYGESIPVTLTVERGPIAYEYDSLLIALYSECEYEYNLASSTPLDNDPKFFSTLFLGVDFIRPCSEVSINVPEQNFVVLQNDPLQPGTIRNITVSNYNLNASDFQLIRVQYRKSGGNGTWKNINAENDIYERYNPNWSGLTNETNLLEPGFTQFKWDTEDLEDGDYEIHAWAVCTGDAIDFPGYSQIIKGKINRQPPQLIGTPQPSDGVLNVGDEISFSFNKLINCSELIEADMINPNNVGLYELNSSQPIDIEVTCFENKIIVDPVNMNNFYENKILNLQLHDIEDLAGNVNSNLSWDFYVDRNELAWLTDSIGVDKFLDDSRSVTTSIHNRGGYPVPFEILNTPDWLRVYPDKGTLVANEIRPINFDVDSSLTFGTWSDTVILRTVQGENTFFMGGDEPLPIGVRVVCRPPAWKVNPADYSYSMNLTLQIEIEGELSDDKLDIVGAFIGGQLCGVGSVKFNSDINKYVVFLTAYSNLAIGETLTFQVWDASTCTTFGTTVETFPFIADDLVGAPNLPQIIHTNSQILRKIYLHPGWNWISYNIVLANPDVNSALSSLTQPSGGLIKSQIALSSYSNNLDTWAGNLTNLTNSTMYQMNVSDYDSLSMVGPPIDVNTPIIIPSGWNWIGYLPQNGLPISEALETLSPTNGDVIKSQDGFAQYVNGLGWIGNMASMNSPNGYMIYLNEIDTLIYPPSSINLKNYDGGLLSKLSNKREENKTKLRTNEWEVTPQEFEYSMNIIGIVAENDGDNILEEGDKVAAFVGDEVRGIGTAIYVEGTDSYYLFMTVYANTINEQITFKMFDFSANTEWNLIEQTNFKINNIWGEIDDPTPFHLESSTGINDDLNREFSFFVFPNPAVNVVHLNLISEKFGKVNFLIRDVLGRTIKQIEMNVHEGLNEIIWKLDADISNGYYFIFLNDGKQIISRKVEVIR